MADYTVGYIGLGRMGKNMILKLLEQGISVVAYNRTGTVTEDFIQNEIPAVIKKNTAGSFKAAQSLNEFVDTLPKPRIIWLMVKAGEAVDLVLADLEKSGVTAGDIIIDGGNSYYKDTIRREKDLITRGIHFIDCGTSGGMEGGRNGACCMIGGDEQTAQSLSWLWNAATVKDGWTHFGRSGAGHFVKMVHNGVEYGMNQALAEGFAILEKSPYNFDLHKVANNWSHGSVVRGWLVELLARAFSKDAELSGYEGRVGGGSTGTWTLEAANELGVDAIVIEDSLKAREKSQKKPTFAGKVVSALRFEYGGHTEK